VTLLEFKGNLQSDMVNLNWKVTNEDNVTSYIVERSTNGQSFNVIGTVKAASNGAPSSNYTLQDNVGNLRNATLYYRLQQVEVNGSAKVSNTIVFRLGGSIELMISVYPNPATSYFVLKVAAVKEAAAEIRLMDVTGKTLMSEVRKMFAGSNAITFNNMTKIAAGTYNIQVIMDGQVFNQKLVIAK
jgi:hypothetical protein